jgi:glycosyltransferase involved in cell wall biosynthesis
VSISVLIPTYNRKEHLFRAIDSVLAQSVPVDEIVVVDDGSTDGTTEAVRAHYGTSVLVFEQCNAGVSAARNRGLREVHGEWVALLDSDDLWLPTKIERQLAALRVFTGKADVCFTNNTFGGNLELTQTAFEAVGFSGAGDIGLLEDTIERILAGTEPFYTPSFLIRRSLFTKIGGFDEALVLREDTDLFFRLCLQTCFCYVSEPLVEIDRTPSRELGLCNLYATRDDRKHRSLERLYSKWLAMPEVAGSVYERSIRDLLKSSYYNSIEDKVRQFRICAVAREMMHLRHMNYSYFAIARDLWSRKMRKLGSKIKKRLGCI